MFISECNILLAILIFRTNRRTYCLLEGRVSVQEFDDTCSQPMQVSLAYLFKEVIFFS